MQGESIYALIPQPVETNECGLPRPPLPKRGKGEDEYCECCTYTRCSQTSGPVGWPQTDSQNLFGLASGLVKDSPLDQYPT